MVKCYLTITIPPWKIIKGTSKFLYYSYKNNSYSNIFVNYNNFLHHMKINLLNKNHELNFFAAEYFYSYKFNDTIYFKELFSFTYNRIINKTPPQ